MEFIFKCSSAGHWKNLGFQDEENGQPLENDEWMVACNFCGEQAAGGGAQEWLQGDQLSQ